MTSYESFDSVYVSDAKPAKPIKAAIESKYTREEIQSKFVVWYKNRTISHSKSEYRVYDTHDDFQRDLSLMEENDRLFHEVIIGKQKLKFDIDMKTDPIDFNHVPLDYPMTIKSDIPDDFNLIVNYIIEKVKQQFYYCYEIDLQPEDIVATDSSRIGVKYSSHIVINNYCVSNHKQAAEFTSRLAKIINKQYKEILDLGVNKSTQNFRITGCHNGDNRVKTIITDHEFADSLITNTGKCAILPDIIESVESAKAGAPIPSGTDVETAVKLSATMTAGHTFRKLHNNMLMYDRNIPTHCEICGETHHNDNSMMVVMVPNSKTVKLLMQCRQFNVNNKGADSSVKNIVIGEFIPMNSSILTAKGVGWSANLIKHLLDVDKPVIHRANNSLINAHSPQNYYEESVLRDFELAKTLIVKAAMKMGKTKTLKRYIDANFPGDGIKKPVIRIISFRQTFSNNVKEKFPDFVLYNDVAGELTHDRLIVQIESLHRIKIYNGGDPPDLLILDECESIFEQFNAGLIKNVDCFSKFQYLLRYSKRVVCMDALVSDRTYNIINHLRPNPEIFFHNNGYKNATDDRYHITHDYDMWLQEVIIALTEGNKIAMPMSSLKIANETMGIIMEKFPKLRVKLYSSETKHSEKREHFANVGHYWSQYDVILYTPTISAGVSFEEKHFSKVFGYFVDKSCPVETCIQMLGRVRDVATKEYYICLSATGNNLPSEIGEIKAALHNTRSALYGDNTLTSAISCEYGENGDIVIHKTPFFQVWLENTRMINISKNYFISHFIEIVRDFGATITQFGVKSDEPSENEANIATIKAKVKENIKNELALRITGAADIGAEEIREIRANMDAQIDITTEEQNNYDRYILRNDYGHTAELTEKFVVAYYPKQQRILYKNIRKIFNGESHDDALLEIQREERAFNRYYMEHGLEQNDLAKNYMFNKHNLAIGVLQACGWSGLNDKTFIEDNQLVIRLASNNFALIVEQASREFNIKEPFRVVKGIDKKVVCGTYVKFITKILSQMYGVSVKQKLNDLDDILYFLKGKKSFIYEFGLASNVR